MNEKERLKLREKVDKYEKALYKITETDLLDLMEYEPDDMLQGIIEEPLNNMRNIAFKALEEQNDERTQKNNGSR